MDHAEEFPAFTAFWLERPARDSGGLTAYALLFDHYQDDGAFYDRRPSLWVEPKSGWGKGAVELVELPTNDETGATTSSRSGNRPGSPGPEPSCCSGTGCTGDRKCRPDPLSRKSWRPARASAAWWAASATTSRGGSSSISPARISR
jgi:hypothetical protein